MRRGSRSMLKSLQVGEISLVILLFQIYNNQSEDSQAGDQLEKINKKLQFIT
jgi:hypothetical protein